MPAVCPNGVAVVVEAGNVSLAVTVQSYAELMGCRIMSRALFDAFWAVPRSEPNCVQMRKTPEPLLFRLQVVALCASGQVDACVAQIGRNGAANTSLLNSSPWGADV